MSLDTREAEAVSDSLTGVGKRPMVRRTFYVPEKVWDAAKARADEEENDISTVLREFLERYVKGRK